MRRQFDAACRQYEVKTLPGKNLANAFIDNAQNLSETQKISENTFRVTTIEADSNAYGQIKIEGLPTDRPVRLLVTYVKESAVLSGSEARVLVWAAPNAGGGTIDVLGYPESGTFLSSARTFPNGYIYLGLYPRAAESGGSATFQISAYLEEDAKLEHEPYVGDNFHWPDGLKSGFPSVEMLGKVEQQSYTGKNLFNIMALAPNPMPDTCITAVDAAGLTITTEDDYVGNGYTNTDMRLRDIAPRLIAGKTYTLSFNTESVQKFIWLVKSVDSWNNGASRMVSESDLDSVVGLYGHASSSGVFGACRITNIQIEAGAVATAYEPYVGGVPSPTPQYPQEVRANNATVRSGGKNLLNLDVAAFSAAADWGASSTRESLFMEAVENIRFKPNQQYTVSAETKLADGSGAIGYVRFFYTDGTASPYAGFALVDARTGIDGLFAITSVQGKTVSRIEYTPGTGGAFETYWMQLEEGAVATPYEPYFDGGEATAPPLLCAANGEFQSTYDPQTGEFVNWWHNKRIFDGSEGWIVNQTIDGFACGSGINDRMFCNANWSNQFPPSDEGQAVAEGPFIVMGKNDFSIRLYSCPFYDKTLPDYGLANWEAHLAQHPLEVWVARNEPEITNIGPQRLTCPTGYGQITQVAGDIPDCPLEVKYLSHGGNVK